MRVAIGSDHAGFAYKEVLKRLLRDLGHEVQDHGTHSDDPVDYPDVVIPVARAVASGEAERGIIVGGSGNGEAMAANKVRGVRAALCHDVTTARLSRLHNDANVLSLGERIIGLEVARDIVRAWLDTAFEGGRHQRRLEKIARVEAEERAPRADRGKPRASNRRDR